MVTTDDVSGWDPGWAAQVTDYALVGLDPSGVICSWNAGAEKLKGWSAEQALERHFSMFYPAEDLATDLPGRLLAQARLDGRVQHTGWRVRRDGTRFWGDVVITALRGADGVLTGFAKITRDRTEQHETEERLRESEARFRLLVSQVADYAIIGLDPSGVIASWNAGASLLKGYSTTEALGEHFSMFYTAEDRRDGLPARLLETARREGRVENSGWRVRKDRTRFWADVVITAIHDETGQLTGFGKVTRDLTDQHAVQQELSRSELRFRLLVSQVSEYAIIGLDPAGIVTSWNAGAQRLKGWTEPEALGAHHSMFYTEADRREDLPSRLLREARARGSAEHVGWRRRRDGSQFWANVVVTAVRDPSGRLQGFAKVTRDTTEQHRLEQARESFVAGMTHDFRSPLMAIGGFASLLADSLEDPQQRQQAVHIVGSAERLSRLVDLLVENSRLQAGGLVMDCHDVDLTAFLQRCLESLGPETAGRRVVVNGSAERAVVDEEALGRVVANLVGNAVKYSPPDTAVEVSVGSVDPWVQIVVADRGRGIAPGETGLLFERFQRGSRAERDGGLGLGLTVVHELVHQMGGRVAILPRPGGGTEVVVDLPGTRAAAERVERDDERRGVDLAAG